ncbi:c6 zinc finger domain containing protein [Sporothrix brasiliensis 5110]|uniref:C6 zinc finger domain containing protein n=1 Tax=Sporothrix brasiliensis 5110 TaxID=1398154 RepID=A0A0C2F8B1_9PEZI|nr:c6 zinc finger domain containing protein [Sporothrix brasiliensis 5110]KIH87273.1 c6 zinc finger domain containing protein [Sporothrix brasiliensis 5110]
MADTGRGPRSARSASSRSAAARTAAGGSPRSSRIPSCEPCRVSKLACDHGRPVCARCSRKGVPGQCVYRKDPFKRVNNSSNARRSSAAQPRSQSHPEPQIRSHVSPAGDYDRLAPLPELPALADGQPPLQLTLYPNPGFQGSSSLNTILDTVEHGAASYEGENEDGDENENEDQSVNANTNGEDSSVTQLGTDTAAPNLAAGLGSGHDPMDGSHGTDGPSPLQGTMLVMSGAAMIEEGAQVLELLARLFTQGIVQQLFAEWMGKGLEVHLGSLLVRPFLDSFDRVLDTPSLLSRRLFHATKVPTDVDSSASLNDFADKYTGRNLRWETVGLILALAGNAVSKLRAPHAVLYRTEQERHALGRQLLHASNTCATFCESLDILNDVQIIFLYESFLLHSVYFGHQSFRVWGRLNTAINALFGRGIHQRLERDARERDGGSGHGLPFFLVELRKHVFALLYSSDINFSVFLGRPPRISKRHCVIHMPLDVNPEAYQLAGEALEDHLRQLDEAGWNTLGQIRTHAVIRWSMITSQIREEALEAIIGGHGSNELPERLALTALRTKIADAWRALPSYLAVPACEVWRARRPGQQTDTLYLIRLYYLQTLFLIEWTASVHGTANLDALFVVASDLLAWVNEAIIMRERLNRLGLNTLAWRVSAFGLPAAGALAKCLLASASTTAAWTASSGATFTKAIRDLSVLIAHMDYLYDSSDGNDKLFIRAKGILIRVLESTLSPRRRGHTQTPTAAAAGAEPQLAQNTSASSVPIFTPPPSNGNANGLNNNTDAFDQDQWEFRPELWIGLPGPNSTEVNHLDFMSDFTHFLD